MYKNNKCIGIYKFDILTFFLLSSVAISMIVWVIQGVNFLDIIAEQGHAIKIYLIYSLLNIPKIFSKLLIFTFFLTLFVVISRYEDNNEIIVFWTNGIKKISFFILGLLIWLLPLIFVEGFNNLIVSAKKQTIGHFTDFGGTAITDTDWTSRFFYFTESIWADGLGGFWLGRSWQTAFFSIFLLSLGTFKESNIFPTISLILASG